jgi:hypothetical protein
VDPNSRKVQFRKYCGLPGLCPDSVPVAFPTIAIACNRSNNQYYLNFVLDLAGMDRVNIKQQNLDELYQTPENTLESIFLFFFLSLTDMVFFS